MNILLYTGIFPPEIGGPAIYVKQLAIRLTEAGDKVIVLTKKPANHHVNKDIPFKIEGNRLLGYILGTSDLLTQISDRAYLEKLILLFKEFEEAGIPGFDTELDLLSKTEQFYKEVAQKRLFEDFQGICQQM